MLRTSPMTDAALGFSLGYFATDMMLLVLYYPCFGGPEMALHHLAAARAGEPGAMAHAKQTLGGAITALQFQDMATQLIAHTSQRLRNCAAQLARDTFGMDDEDGAAVVEIAPLRPNPVTQDEMDAGSIELF